MNLRKHFSLGLSIIAVALLCAGCSEPPSVPNLQISELQSIEIPNRIYTFDANNPQVRSTQKECIEIVKRLATIFDAEVDFENGLFEADRGLECPTIDGGVVGGYLKAGAYFNSGKLACALDSTAQQVNLINLWENEQSEIKYKFGDVWYSPSEAIDFFERLWESDLSQLSFAEQIKAEKVLVYERADGTTSFVLLFNKCYADVSIEQFSTLGQSMKTPGYFRKSFILVEMDGPESIYHYVDYYPYQIVDQAEIETDVLSQEEAIELASAKLAQYSTYEAKRMAFCYGCFAQKDDSIYHYRPYWCFVLKEKETADGCDNYQPNITLFIDAQDGTAYLVDSINYATIEIS